MVLVASVIEPAVAFIAVDGFTGGLDQGREAGVDLVEDAAECAESQVSFAGGCTFGECSCNSGNFLNGVEDVFMDLLG